MNNMERAKKACVEVGVGEYDTTSHEIVAAAIREAIQEDREVLAGVIATKAEKARLAATAREYEPVLALALDMVAKGLKRALDIVRNRGLK